MAGRTKALIAAASPGGPALEIALGAVERRLMGRRIQRLRRDLGLSQAGFAAAYGIPLSSIRQYEIGRHMPPPAVRAYLKVIAAEPERAARAVAAFTTGLKLRVR